MRPPAGFASTPLKNYSPIHLRKIPSASMPISGPYSAVPYRPLPKSSSCRTSSPIPPSGRATFFYRFYLNQALKKVGMADRYYSQLAPWREMLKLGLTTFAEKPEPTRSDCHAWSASPDYDFLATICGIMPAAPAFEKVLIAPALGELTEAGGSMPHPYGMISVEFHRTASPGGIHATITLPGKLTGIFKWNSRSVPLHGGSQVIDLNKQLQHERHKDSHRAVRELERGQGI